MTRVILLAAVLVLAGGTVRGKDAPATRPATQQAVSPEVSELRERIRQLEAENSELRQKLRALAGAQPSSEDRIKAAVRDHRIIVGMSEAQIQQAMGDTIVQWQHRDAEQAGAGGNPQTVRYIVIGSNRWGNFEVWLTDGRVTRVEH